MKFESELRKSVDENILVRIERGDFEDSCPELEGKVVSFSDSIVCVAVLDDRVRFNGFDIFYREQITDIESPAPHAGFYDAALRLRDEAIPQAPPLDLSSMRSVLESATEVAPLLVIHREADEPEVCEIGQVTSLGDESFEMREIDPDAEWDDDRSEFPYEDVTRVSYGGEYEAALALVAGVVL